MASFSCLHCGAVVPDGHKLAEHLVGHFNNPRPLDRYVVRYALIPYEGVWIQGFLN